MRSSLSALTAALAAFASLALAGCAPSSEDIREEVAIPPASAVTTEDLGLGPKARPLSFGPGDKGSPRVSPSGERVAFVLDGYVVEKPISTQIFRSRTPKDFGAGQTEWLLNGDLAVLSPKGEEGSAKTTPAPNSLFAAPPNKPTADSSPDMRKFAESVGAVGAVPGGGAIAAVVTFPTAEPAMSRLVLLQGSEEPMSFYLRSIEGHVTGLSVSPDGRQAALAVRRNTDDAGDQEMSQFEVQVYQFSEGLSRRVALVPEGMEILGAPQWTQEGVYFLAGEAADPIGTARSGEPVTYALYRTSEGSGTPAPVRGVGEDFVAASISTSPDGNRLAVVGRRNPSSPTNLYVLDLASDSLETVTTNENMEIKAGPRNLAWSSDGRYVILVARGALSGPKAYDAPAGNLLSAFYNLYLVEVGGSEG
jgi:hypothetical protein